MQSGCIVLFHAPCPQGLGAAPCLPRGSLEHLGCHHAACRSDAHRGDGGHVPCALWLPGGKAELGTMLSLGGAGSREAAWHSGVCHVCSCPDGTSPSTDPCQRQPRHAAHPAPSTTLLWVTWPDQGKQPRGAAPAVPSPGCRWDEAAPPTQLPQRVGAGKPQGGALRAAPPDAFPAWGRGWLPPRCQDCAFTQPQPLATVVKNQPDSFFP